VTEGEFRSRVEAVVAALGPGDLVTYGEVAAEAGFPGAARAVGRIMAHPDPERVPELPWWRVVTASGRLVPGLEKVQTRLLAREGIHVSNGRVIRTGRIPG
jgi:methylated-DNA-protein-cysteine methyltransferase-like protein